MQIIHHLNTFGWMSSEPAEWIEWFAWMAEHFVCVFIRFVLFFSFLLFTFAIDAEKRRKDTKEKWREKIQWGCRRRKKSPFYRCWKREASERTSAERMKEKNVCLKWADSKVMQVLIQFIAYAKSKEFILCASSCWRLIHRLVYNFFVTGFPCCCRHEVPTAGVVRNF